MRLNYHGYSQTVASSCDGGSLLRVCSPGHTAGAYFVQDVVGDIVEVAPMVSVGEDSGDLDGGIGDVGVGDARAGVADVATVKSAGILLPDGLAVHIGVEGHIHGHASGSDHDVATVYELLGHVVGFFGAVGIVAASYQSYDARDGAEHDWCSYRPDLSVSGRPASGSHLELLVLDSLTVGVLEEVQYVYALRANLLAPAAAYADLIEVGEFLIAALNGFVNELADPYVGRAYEGALVALGALLYSFLELLFCDEVLNLGLGTLGFDGDGCP